MKHLHVVRNWKYLALVICLVSSLRGQVSDSQGEAFETLADWENVSEVMRHLYRWYLDDADLVSITGADSAVCYILPLELELDEGDHSLFAEIYIPAFGVLIRLKQTDYRVEELALEVASDTFKIINVERVDSDYAVPENAIRRAIPVEQMRDYLFQTRHQQDPPSPELLKRLRTSVRGKLEGRLDSVPGDGVQTVFISPISPVSNEIWVYWQDAKLLIRWKSDIDITHPAVWEHERLMVDIFDIEAQVVLSFSDVPGSNAYLTRDRVGRVLYNCTVLGQKLEVPR